MLLLLPLLLLLLLLRVADGPEPSKQCNGRVP
jgi:hypothetical protein